MTKDVLISYQDGSSEKFDEVTDISLHAGFFQLQTMKKTYFINASLVQLVSSAPHREKLQNLVKLSDLPKEIV